MKRIGIVLVEDHEIVRHGLRLLVESQADLLVLAEASNGLEAMDVIATHRPDIVVFDITMPVLSGIQMAKQLRAASYVPKLLALTANEDKAYLNELIQVGVAGYLLKRSAARDLIEAIRTLASDRRFLDPNIVGEMVNDMFVSKPNSAMHVRGVLTDREEEVIRLIAKGYTNKEAAKFLDISIKTIETHKARAMNKLNLQSRAELIRHAASMRWISDE